MTISDEDVDDIDRAINCLGEALRSARGLKSLSLSLSERELMTKVLVTQLGQALIHISISREATAESEANVPPHPHPSTKRARVIELMRTPGGVLVDDIEKELGWTRGALSSVITGLRRDGFVIERYRRPDERRSRYQIS